MACPLLEGVTLNGARGVLVYITASEETMKMKETKTVMNIITNFTAKGAQVIYGSAYDDSMGDSMRVTVVATGLDGGKDKDVAPIEKPEEKFSVWESNNRAFDEPKQQPDPWQSRQSASQPATTPVQQPVRSLNETQPSADVKPAEEMAAPAPETKPEQPAVEEKAQDEWEKGWWAIRHDTK